LVPKAKKNTKQDYTPEGGKNPAASHKFGGGGQIGERVNAASWDLRRFVFLEFLGKSRALGLRMEDHMEGQVKGTDISELELPCGDKSLRGGEKEGRV